MSHTPEHHNLRGRILRSLFFQFIAKGGERILRLVVLALLARVLSQDDFGLMAAVAAALAAIEALTFLPTEAAITASSSGREPRFLHTVFWIQCIRGMLIAIAVAAVSPFLAGFYNHADDWPLFAIIALQPLFTGFTSPRSEVLVKDLKLAAWSMARFAAAIVGLGVSVVLAYTLKSAWALVLGQVTTQAAITIAGYIIAPYRPQLRFDKESWREIRGYCAQAAGIPVLIALVYQAPAFILGRTAGLPMLGLFTLNKRLADLPIEVALGVVAPVAAPAYATLRHDTDRLARAWLTALRWIATLALPAAVALVWVDAVIPQLMYGDDYRGASMLFGLLAIDGTITALISVTGPLFWGTGRPSFDRWCQIVRVGVLYACGIVLTLRYGAIGMAIALVASSAASLVVSMILAARLTSLSPGRIIRESLAAGIAGALIMGALLYVIDVAISPQGITRLAIGLAAGAIWLVAGPIRPMVLALRKRAEHVASSTPLPNAA